MDDQNNITQLENNDITNNENYGVKVGKNPHKEQIIRLKKCIEHLEKSQIYIQEMGVIYMEFNNTEHSEYCMALYQSIETVKEAVCVFTQDM